MTTNTNNTTPQEAETCQAVEADRQTRRDALYATLAVSLVVNAFILTGWLALRVTSQFDGQVASLLFS